MFYSVKVAEMTGIKNFLAYGTFFGSFWKTLQSLSIPFANFYFKLQLDMEEVPELQKLAKGIEKFDFWKIGKGNREALEGFSKTPEKSSIC